jgi:hypothetical protein
VAQSDRDVLFGNEAFALGMLQAVSGGGVVAALSQAQAIVAWAGRMAFLIFVSAFALALALSVLSAYWRHQYKMWDVKTQASLNDGHLDEAQRRSRKSNFHLWGMRYTLGTAVAFVLFGLCQFVVALWVSAHCNSAAT